MARKTFFTFSPWLLALEKYSVPTLSPQTQSSGTCGQLYATMTATWFWTGDDALMCSLFLVHWQTVDWMWGFYLVSILQYINQRFQHRDRWVGALTSTHAPCKWRLGGANSLLKRRFNPARDFKTLIHLHNLLPLLCFSAHDLRTPGPCQPSSTVHPSLYVSDHAFTSIHIALQKGCLAKTFSGGNTICQNII